MASSPNFIYEFGPFRLDAAEARLLRDGVAVPLPPKTFELLELLVRRAGSLVDRDTVMRELWPDAFVEEANIARHVWMLRQVLADGECIETVPKRGYRFVAAVRAAAQRPRAADPAIPRVMVLPFRMRATTDTALDVLAEGLPEAIAAALAASDRLIVRSTLVAARYAADAPDVARIAAEADVNRLITGTVIGTPDRVRVTAQLLDAPAGTLMATAGGDAAHGDLFQLQDQLVAQLVAALLPTLGAPEARAVRGRAPAEAEAYGWFLRANRMAHRPADYHEALRLYRACVDADPQFAQAWARLGRLYRVLGKYGDEPELRQAQAEEALQRALAIDPDLALAHAYYAYLEVDLGRAPDAMVRLLGRAARHPTNADLFAGLVHACRYSGLLDASIAAHHRVVQLDPLVPTSVVQSYWMRGDLTLALAESAKLAGGSLRAMVLALTGREAEAIADLRDQEARMPQALMRHFSAALRTVLEGDRDGCLAAIDELLRGRPTDPEGLFFIARYLAKIDEPSRAIDVLRQAIDGGFTCAGVMHWDPWLEGVRQLAAFDVVRAEAERRARAAADAYRRAGGERILG